VDTLVRFDPVYVTHFKCDKRRISDYPNLYGFLRDIYQMPGIAETVSFPISATTTIAAIKR
jgi:putative glutathione S-transferase